MTEEPKALEAEAAWLEANAESFRQRAQDLRDSAATLAHEALVRKLEGLPFIMAKSGTCDWIEAAKVPEELRSLFDAKGVFKTEKFQFVTTKEGNLLRFIRKEATTTPWIT